MGATEKQKKWNEPERPVRPTKSQDLEKWLDEYELSVLERDRYVGDMIPRKKASRAS